MLSSRRADRARAEGADALTFGRARRRLTLWYAAVLAVIVVGFSVALYAALASALDSHHGDPNGGEQQQTTERDVTTFTLTRLRLILITGNVLLLVGLGGGAYLLSGKTLRPVGDAMRRQRRFSADASHELRTPLTVMRGAVDVALQRERSAAYYRETLNEVRDEVDVMARMVDDLLRLARGEPRSRAATQQCDLGLVLQGTLRDLAPALAAHRSPIEAPGLATCLVHGDAATLRRVFANLLQNALAHTPPGTPLALQMARRGSTVEVAVVDHGPGIPEGERERVFEPFYRGRDAGGEGSGLGLALVAELVQFNDGQIELRETDGGGATVVVRLPAA